jgi:hypothetical protein
VYRRFHSQSGTRTLALLGVGALLVRATAGENPGAVEFRTDIRPILETYCFDCHGDGMNKGNVAFDDFRSDQAAVEDRQLWWKALKNLRANLMPPATKPRPNPEQRERIAHWIKSDVFGIDPRSPDPGRVTIRRLNRVEYRNTIRDLLGVDFNTASEFPPDDTSLGFDTIADALTLPPMLLEKYLDASEKVVGQAVPTVSGGRFHSGDDPENAGGGRRDGPLSLNYERFFPKEVPSGAARRRQYARELLGNFARRAFRRPVDDRTVNRLAKVAESVYSQRGKTFEAGIAEGMVAVLASPRFLFREETAEPASGNGAYPFVDQYSLASRLSYFLWSSTPDDELLRLAANEELRNHLAAQVARMLKDSRSEALVHNFTGQWLRARDIEDVQIEARSVLARETKFDPEVDKSRHRFRELSDKPEETLTKEEKDELAALRDTFSKRFKRSPRAELTGELRRAMRLETEDTFDYVLRQDRSLQELLDSDYTFLNEKLALHYGITNVLGQEMRRVMLPPDSVRGGILTEGTVLVVTSNPTRTSPVKRGLFVLDNILGTPPPPPPPDIPPLEDAAKGLTNHVPTLRETLAEHRKNPLCSSCHNRMDPLGLALENFNAMGMWREAEYDEPIDATGQLITGETFSNVKELKRIIVKDHCSDFYRTVTEKLLTYALGRGLEYYDVETVDQIVARIEKANGRASALLAGVVESAPFQRCRKPSSATASVSSAERVAINSFKP